MSYRFEQSTKKRAGQTAAATAIVGALIGGLSYFIMTTSSGGPAVLFSKIFGGLTLVVVAIMTLWYIFLASKKQNWLIEVSDNFFLWKAPKGIGERSFELPVSEIDRVVRLASTDPEFEDRYILITKTGDEIVLKPQQSGVNVNKIFQSLADAGVRIENRTQA